MEILPREQRVEALLEQRFDWTARQREVLDLLARDKSNGEIAEALGISLDGAKWHMREILSKLGVESREEAAEYWRRHESGAGRLSRYFRAGLALGPWRWVGVGVVLVGLGTATAIAIAAMRSNSDHSPPTTAEPATSATASPVRPTPPSERFIRIPTEIAWLGSFLPAIPASGVEMREIRLSLLTSMLGIEGHGAWIQTDLGVLQLARLPAGVGDKDVMVREPTTAPPPGAPPWRYEFLIPGLPPTNAEGRVRLHFVVGSGLIAMADTRALADKVATTLGGPVLP